MHQDKPEDIGRVQNGWAGHRLLVMHEMGRLDKNQRILQDNQGELGRQLTILQVRVFVWGALGAMVGTAIMGALLMNFFGRGGP